MNEHGNESPRRNEGTLPDYFNALWRNPGRLIREYKEMLKQEGKSMAERLGQCPLPIRIHTPVVLTQEQIESLGLESSEARLTVLLEKDSMFQMYVYGDKTTGEEHVAVIKGVGNGNNVPIRIHSSCLTAETFHASNCDCHEQLEMSLAIVELEGFGGVIWLHQEGRGNGLAGKAAQLKLMLEEGLDTVTAFEKAGYPNDQRDYSIAVDILRDLGIKGVRLITNNPNKMAQLSSLGMNVDGRIPCKIPPINDIVRKDLQAKKDRLGHLFQAEDF